MVKPPRPDAPRSLPEAGGSSRRGLEAAGFGPGAPCRAASVREVSSRNARPLPCSGTVHPARAHVPPDAGRRVLERGCGVGRLAHHLAAGGASEVIGVDLSERMLELARAECSHPRLTYVRESIEQVRYPPDRFDLVVSSLAFHYVEDYQGLIRRIAGWLVPGGILVYSTEHPVYLTRASTERSEEHTSELQSHH